jgi:hypothetical protein
VAVGWLGAAAVAVLVGLLAISVIGRDLTSGPGSVRSEDDVARQLAAAPPAPGTSAPASSPAPGTSVPGSSLTPGASAPTVEPGASGAAPDAGPSATLTSAGGTVVARCTAAGGAEVVSVSPRSGYALHERHGTEGEFRSASDNHDRVRFTVACAGGKPSLTVREDGRGGD